MFMTMPASGDILEKRGIRNGNLSHRWLRKFKDQDSNRRDFS
jgi:hypothetical protein